VLDTRDGRLLRTVAVGQSPVAVTVDADTHHAFVLNAGRHTAKGDTAGTVSVLDTRTDRLLRTQVGLDANAVAVDVRQGRLVAANTGSDSVSLLDARTGTLLRTVAVGWAPRALAVDERRARVFIVNEDDGTISVLDARSGATLYTIQIDHHAVALPLSPYAIAVDEARDRVYVSTWGQPLTTGRSGLSSSARAAPHRGAPCGGRRLRSRCDGGCPGSHRRQTARACRGA
jgi:YVTN family beta-propeller protein